MHCYWRLLPGERAGESGRCIVTGSLSLGRGLGRAADALLLAPSPRGEGWGGWPVPCFRPPGAGERAGESGRCIVTGSLSLGRGLGRAADALLLAPSPRGEGWGGWPVPCFRPPGAGERAGESGRCIVTGSLSLGRGLGRAADALLLAPSPWGEGWGERPMHCYWLPLPGERAGESGRCIVTGSLSLGRGLGRAADALLLAPSPWGEGWGERPVHWFLVPLPGERPGGGGRCMVTGSLSLGRGLGRAADALLLAPSPWGEGWGERPMHCYWLPLPGERAGVSGRCIVTGSLSLGRGLGGAADALLLPPFPGGGGWGGRPLHSHWLPLPGERPGVSGRCIVTGSLSLRRGS